MLDAPREHFLGAQRCVLGAYDGATGTVTGRAVGQDDTFFTIQYTR